MPPRVGRRFLIMLHFSMVHGIMSDDFYVEFKSVVRGFHAYRSVWTSVLGEQLSTQQEYGNPEDRYRKGRNFDRTNIVRFRIFILN